MIDTTQFITVCERIARLETKVDLLMLLNIGWIGILIKDFIGFIVNKKLKNGNGNGSGPAVKP